MKFYHDHADIVVPTGFKQRFKEPKKLRDKRDPMFDLVPNPCDVIVEIGSQWGWWALRAHRAIPSALIFCVDVWEDSERSLKEWRGGADNLYEWALNLGDKVGSGIEGLHGNSVGLAKLWKGQIDFLFVDGDHEWDGIWGDLCGWVPQVRTGGLIVGHDWAGVCKTHVRPAVRKYFGEDGFKVDDLYYGARGRMLSPCWYVYKEEKHNAPMG